MLPLSEARKRRANARHCAAAKASWRTPFSVWVELNDSLAFRIVVTRERVRKPISIDLRASLRNLLEHRAGNNDEIHSSHDNKDLDELCRLANGRQRGRNHD